MSNQFPQHKVQQANIRHNSTVPGVPPEQWKVPNSNTNLNTILFHLFCILINNMKLLRLCSLQLLVLLHDLFRF
jgi:hypothetical protein